MASSAGREIIVKHTSDSTNTVTIDGNAAEQIDGAATCVIHERASVTLICDGARWHIL